MDKLLRYLQKISAKKRFDYLILGILFLFAFYICFFKLGHSLFENWDEAWYAEVIKQMMRTKDFIMPHWNGDILLDKPPLYFWLSSFFAIFLGVTEFSVRLPSAISGFVLIFLVVVYAYRRWGLTPALFTYSALALNNLFIWRTRSGNLDALVTLLIFLVYLLMVSTYKYRYALLGIVFGLIFLVKASLVAFPLAVFGLYELVFNIKHFFKNLIGYVLLGSLFILVAGSWLVAGAHESGKQVLDYYLFQSDQGVSAFSLSNFKLDYLSYVYYSLQRKLFFVFIVGVFFILLKIYKRVNFAILAFSLLLLIQLSFTQKTNNWYLLPSVPFWALAIGYGVKRAQEIASRFISEKIVVGVLLISLLYTSYKTFTVNIIPIINQEVNITEVASARIINSLSNNPHDIILRLDAAYPVTIYYADRKTIYYDHVDHSLYLEIKELGIRWIVGKKEKVDEFIEKNEGFQLMRYDQNDESILHILSY